MQGQQFMVMELLEGESLKARIARGPLPLDDVLDLGAQIADALDAAHSAGVVHRDIKPANLFITRRGQAKVLDFGVAKLARRRARIGPRTRDTVAGSELTTAGSAVGTVVLHVARAGARPGYRRAQRSVLVWAACCYEMATGRQAFAGPTLGRDLRRDPDQDAAAAVAS